jgi:hypothetical protein
MEAFARRAPLPGDIPVAVPGDLVLVQRTGVLAWAGAITVSSAGFQFALSITADVTRPGIRLPDSFALHLHERADRTWLEVRFADGRACAADLNTNTCSGGTEDLCLDFLYGEASESVGRDDSRWWVSPLPPPGPVELVIHLNGQAGPVGTGVFDGHALLQAAARVERAWHEA